MEDMNAAHKLYETFTTNTDHKVIIDTAYEIKKHFTNVSDKEPTDEIGEEFLFLIGGKKESFEWLLLLIILYINVDGYEKYLEALANKKNQISIKQSEWAILIIKELQLKMNDIYVESCNDLIASFDGAIKAKFSNKIEDIKDRITNQIEKAGVKMLFWHKLFSKIGVSSSKEKMRVIVSGLLALKKVEETDIALKNGNMKLVKSLFEDVEILMPTSNFNKHGKSYQPSSSRSWTLICPNCGKRYIVGEDSILVSDENLMEAFFQAGVIGILGTQARKPDLAINKGNLSPLERQKALENIQRIKQDLRQGLSRTWSCFHCSDNAYPNWAV